MWSSTNQRIKALMAARNREKERLNRPIHVLRADILLRVQNESGEIPIQSRALLNDFTVDGITLYAATALSPNVDLVLEINQPKSFQVVGRVIWCQYQSSHSHVITRESFPYRVGIAFKFQTAEEETEFRKFCEEMGEAYSQKGHLKILGDPTQRSNSSLTGNFAPESHTPISGDIPQASGEQIAEAMAAVDVSIAESSGAAPESAGSQPGENIPDMSAPQESVTDVLSQLGVQLPPAKKKPLNTGSFTWIRRQVFELNPHVLLGTLRFISKTFLGCRQNPLFSTLGLLPDFSRAEPRDIRRQASAYRYSDQAGEIAKAELIIPTCE